MTNELTATSILSLFETNKEQRQSFALGVIEALDNGQVDPLKVHLQVKCMEDIIKLLNSNDNYKKSILGAAEKYGQKSFQFHNSKVEIKEAGVKYDFSQCGDVEWERINAEYSALGERMKEREKFLKTIPVSGIDILNDQTGEVTKVYPPSKSSTTAVVITLK